MSSISTKTPSVNRKEPKKVKVDFMNWALGGSLLGSSRSGKSRKIIVTDSNGRSKVVERGAKSDEALAALERNGEGKRTEEKKPEKVGKPAEPESAKDDSKLAESERKSAEVKKKDETVVVVVVEEGKNEGSKGKGKEREKLDAAKEPYKKDDKPTEPKKGEPAKGSEMKSDSSKFTAVQDAKILSMKADNKSWKDISNVLNLPKKGVIARWKELSKTPERKSDKGSEFGKNDGSSNNIEKEKEKERKVGGDAFEMSGALNNNVPTTSKETPAFTKTTETVNDGSETTIKITTTTTSPKNSKEVKLTTISTTTSNPTDKEQEKENEKSKAEVTRFTTTSQGTDESAPTVHTPKPTPGSPPPPKPTETANEAETELLCDCEECVGQREKAGKPKHRLRFSEYSQVLHFSNDTDNTNKQRSQTRRSSSGQNQSRPQVPVYQGRLRPNDTWTREDCEILDSVERRYKDNKWLEVQAAFFNWTGRMIDGEVIRGKFENDGAI